ncbi:MAG TPA: hypothetical protein VHV74_24955, partial [Pseudonocardiaceae bacterium]|nr:hypothetical protein [Pseudonocardiaceae bacterium]
RRASTWERRCSGAISTSKYTSPDSIRRSRRLAQFVALLERNEVPFQTADDRIVVAAEAACGSVVVFRA